MSDLLRMTAQRADYDPSADLIRGIASTIGNVDRIRRVFLPGAFGTEQKRVPLLAYHDDQRPLGSSLLTPEGGVLRHESQLADIPSASEFRALIKAGAIPATSIGWVSDAAYVGFSQLEKADRQLAGMAIAAGVPKREDVVYYARAEVVENSLVPVPANPLALLSAASLFSHESGERAMLDSLIELASGQRHSQSDQEYLQTAHDALVSAGALCGSAATDPEGEGDDQAALDFKSSAQLAVQLADYEFEV